MKRMMRIAAGACMALVGIACARGGTARPAEPVPFEVRGVVVDARTREPAGGVVARLPEMQVGDEADRSGAFHIRGHARPGRYVVTVSRFGYEPRQVRVRIRGGTVDVGTIAVRASVIQIDDLIVPGCLRHDRPPPDTTPGHTVRTQTDSTGTFWLVCKPAGNP